MEYWREGVMIILFIVVILLLFVIIQLKAKKKEYNKEKVQQAVKASKASTMGKSLEHIIPYFPEFAYNPNDIRFLGAPIDFIVFDGLSEGEIEEVVFVEVKTGRTGALPKRERQIRDCIKEGKVRWEKLHAKEVDGVIQFVYSEN